MSSSRSEPFRLLSESAESHSELWTLDRKSTRLNSSHTDIYTLSLHDALPICFLHLAFKHLMNEFVTIRAIPLAIRVRGIAFRTLDSRSEEHTSELQSH